MKLVKFLKIHLNLYTLISFNVYLIWANIRKHQFYMRTVFQIKNALQKKFKNVKNVYLIFMVGVSSSPSI